jgi:beta-lactamase regulating signal transducer with metallopeptidase domain
MNHHLESLGWTLLHFCWQAAAIALVYWFADAVLSKARSQTRYVLALATLLLMLSSALATLTYEETRSYSGPSSSPGAFSSPAMATIGPGISIDLAPLTGLNPTRATVQPMLLHLSRLLPWLDFAWLLGVAWLSTRTIAGWRLIQRLRRSALVAAPEAVHASFARLCKRLGIARHISLCISEHIPGPLAMGIVRSLIILPASALMALNPEQLEAVLAHELAHVRRADYFWNLVQTMIETLFFFHPAVWWLGRRLRQQRELCCDDVAVQSCADPLIYATALLRLEERRTQHLNLAMALDGHRSWSGLRDRIARILGETNGGETTGDRSPRDFVPLPLAAICALFLLILLPVPQIFAGLRKTMQIQSATPAVSAPQASTPAPATMSVPAPAVSPAAEESSPISPAAQVAPTITAASDGASAMATADAQGSGKGAGEGTGQGTGQGAGEGAGQGAGRNGSADDGENADQASNPDTSTHKPDYIDGMRAAGYDVDVDKYVAMKVQGITPEYAREMAKAGFGKPSANDLIAMKIQGVTPEYVSGLRAAGIQPGSIRDLISYRIFGVTPEFLAGMKAAGFDSIPPNKLVALRVQGVTPEYARTVKQQYPNVTTDELVQLRIFHIDDAFLAAAKRHGFTSLSIQKLVQLRISGVLGEDDGEAK